MKDLPSTLAQIADRTESLEDFGRNLRDWLHELRRISSRPQVRAAMADKPRTLRRNFTGGAVADAWLAAYAELLSQRTHSRPPEWSFSRSRIAPEPWFANESGSLGSRILALREAPLAFKRRNLYTHSVELPLRLRAGRPGKSPSEKRRANAERQRRFRRMRKAEMDSLRALLR